MSLRTRLGLAIAGLVLALVLASWAAGGAVLRPLHKQLQNTMAQEAETIAEAVEKLVKSHKLEVVREYVGHGIGQQLHEEPSVPNYKMDSKGPTLRPGMVLAIEPMVVAGGWRTKVLDDDWTVVTADGKLSSHFEHTVAVTKEGHEILTLRKSELP